MTVTIGPVETFPNRIPDKAQLLKITEEACEVYSAWEDWFDSPHQMECDHLLDELADVILATCNFIAALGIDEFGPYMERCRRRNEKRGRYS